MSCRTRLRMRSVIATASGAMGLWQRGSGASPSGRRGGGGARRPRTVRWRTERRMSLRSSSRKGTPHRKCRDHRDRHGDVGADRRPAHQGAQAHQGAGRAREDGQVPACGLERRDRQTPVGRLRLPGECADRRHVRPRARLTGLRPRTALLVSRSRPDGSASSSRCSGGGRICSSPGLTFSWRIGSPVCSLSQRAIASGPSSKSATVGA